MLTPEQRTMFDENGFVHGFAICARDEMVPIRRQIEAVLEEGNTKFRHLDSRVVYELCSHEEVIGRVASILGPDLLLFHSSLFNKPPGGETFEWHQDAPFWPMEPDIFVSAWIAIDRADSGNGCLATVPGSHRRRVPEVAMEGGGFWARKTDPTFVDETKKVSIKLEPGEFVIFDGWVVHGSPPNKSTRRRLCLVARFIPPQVKLIAMNILGEFPQTLSSASRLCGGRQCWP
jgi:ectoine hydroxylase-related dioxygenase (phytanoyl-CoA dioxygenase family)